MAQTGEEKSARREIVQELYRHPVKFCRTILPHWFSQEMPWVHWGILAILTKRTDFLLECPDLPKVLRFFTWEERPGDPSSPRHPIFSLALGEGGEPCGVNMMVGKYVLLMLPRGFSKTTLTKAAVIYMILYEEQKYPLFVSESMPHAESSVNDVRLEIETNSRILEFFGDLRPHHRAQKWTDDLFETSTGIAVGARGRGGQIRGRNKRAQRPTIQIWDDLEDEESVSTEGQRLKVRTWAYRSAIPALPELDDNATIFAIGTLLHPRSLLATLSLDPLWTTVVFGGLDPDGDPLWPAMMDKGKLEGKKASFALAGQLPAYYMEYFNLVRADETAKFRIEDIILVPPPPKDDLVIVLAADPAVSDSPDACMAALVVCGMEKNGLVHVLEAEGWVGIHQQDFINKIFEFVRRWSVQKVGIESNAYQKALIHFIQPQMFHFDTFFEIEPIISVKSKFARVEGSLSPRYRSGYMRHARHFPQLVTQLLDWPQGDRDIADALAMAVSMLTPLAPAHAEPGKDLGADDYASLDEIFQGPWEMDGYDQFDAL